MSPSGSRCRYWYTSTSQKVTGIKHKVANLTVSSLSNGGFEGIIDGIVISDVIDDYSDGIFKIIELEEGEATVGDVKISAMPDRIKEGIKTATFHDLIEAGLLEDNGISDKLNTKLPNKDSSGNYVWWSLTVTGIINALLA